MEDSDGFEQWKALLAVPDVPHLSKLKIGAVRELFEETGVLLSEPALEIPKERTRELRTRVQQNGDEFATMCQVLA